MLKKRLTQKSPCEDRDPSTAKASIFGGDAAVNLIFDENIAALVQHVLSPKGVYLGIADRLERLLDHLDFDPDEIIFATRSFDSYLPSLYCETLKSTRFQPFQRFMVTPRCELSWAKPVDLLARTFPDAKLTIYRSEDFRGHGPALLSYATGVPAAEIRLATAGDRPGFSQQAVDMLEAKHRVSTVTPLDVRETVRNYPKGPDRPAFMPFDEDTRAALSKLYKHDIAPTLRPTDLESAG